MNADQLEDLRALPVNRSDEAYLLSWLYEQGLTPVNPGLLPTTESVITARLGTRLDGVFFSLAYYPTCYRRGPWCLQVDINSGPGHERWGCFDEADQPIRNYHSKEAALSEADSIAFVLIEDRVKHGPIVLIKDRVKHGPIADTNPPPDPDDPVPPRQSEPDSRQTDSGSRQTDPGERQTVAEDRH